MNPYQVFHSFKPELRKKLHVVLVRPEQGGNVGAAVRALANMGVEGNFHVVGTPEIINPECQKFAVNAKERLSTIQFFPSLEAALPQDPRALKIAATARIGSAGRPHPLWVRPAMERAAAKLTENEIEGIWIVFGPESDGLMNHEVDLCDWVVTIPSSETYRSLNLSQAILIFSYELHLCLLQPREAFESAKPSQRERLITHALKVAETVGFILPDDPFKMRAKLEDIFSRLPAHIPEARTLHGLLDQIARSVAAGKPELKGRYKQFGGELDGRA